MHPVPRMLHHFFKLVRMARHKFVHPAGQPQALQRDDAYLEYKRCTRLFLVETLRTALAQEKAESRVGHGAHKPVREPRRLVTKPLPPPPHAERQRSWPLSGLIAVIAPNITGDLS